MRTILARPIGFPQEGCRERERERESHGIVIALACDREKTLVGKLDCDYEKVRKHSVSLGKSDISSRPGTAVNQTTDR